ncbi:hypothetical protein C8Q79DRAFT_927731 [Trametes meyenii]|nr:hypothetical protein C8Q79DRAFT_927731 [Trametes meyenii]
MATRQVQCLSVLYMHICQRLPASTCGRPHAPGVGAAREAVNHAVILRGSYMIYSGDVLIAYALRSARLFMHTVKRTAKSFSAIMSWKTVKSLSEALALLNESAPDDIRFTCLNYRPSTHRRTTFSLSTLIHLQTYPTFNANAPALAKCAAHAVSNARLLAFLYPPSKGYPAAQLAYFQRRSLGTRWDPLAVFNQHDRDVAIHRIYSCPMRTTHAVLRGIRLSHYDVAPTES